MQKTKGKILTALLLTALTLTLFPLANASSGNILINDTAQPQDLPIPPVPAGGNVSLYFGDVTFSGSQFYLLLSQDGLSQVSSGDIRYTPLFNVADVTATITITEVPGTTAYPGAWTIGQRWINGSTPLNVPGGTFYIKAFDGAVAALAVTQGFPVSASMRIIPDAGAAGTAIIVNGNAFAPNALVNLSYVNPVTLDIVRFANLTQCNALGQFNYSMPAPDLRQVPPPGDSSPVTNIITFFAIANGTTVTYNATYAESQRGLLQLGRPRVGAVVGNLQNATGVYGNLTSFNLAPTISGTTISVGVGDSFRIIGNWFYPGVVTILWDNSIDVAPTGNTANGTGFFNATFTVPGTGLGSHNITLIDSGLQSFIVYVNVVASITISPTSGPVGTIVTVNGYGFPSQGDPAGTAYNVTVTFGTSTTVRAWSLTDANGQFTTTFTVPASPGGANSVNATANNTALTTAVKSFTVTANFTVSPTSFYANSTGAVTATGTGFDPSKSYYAAIDNLFSPFTNTTHGVTPTSTGALTLTFIQAGFQPGLHVIALYQAGSTTHAPVANATFTVLQDPASPLGAINETVTRIDTNLRLINATVVAINGNIATLSSAIGNLTITVNQINATVVSISGSVATIRTDVGVIRTNVTTIMPQITSISSGVATVQTSVGTLQTSLSSIDGRISSVAGTVGTISTSVGSITSELSAINTKVTSISNGVATIQTDVGTIKGTVTATDGKVATIQTNLGTLQADVADVQTSVDNVPGAVNLPIWIAVILALVAAIASILCLVLMRRKIAG